MKTKRIFQKERRVEPRARPDGIIGVRLRAGGRTEGGTLVDINNTGAFIATSLLLEEGTEILLEVEVPGTKRFPPIRGVVVRTKAGVSYDGDAQPTGLAVRFLAESDEGRERIQVVVRTTMALDLLECRS